MSMPSVPKISPNLVIADWDETITLEDTIKFVAETAYMAKPNFSPTFKHFTEVYINAYNEYNSQFLKEYGQRNSIEKEIKFQAGIKKVEMRSINEMTRLNLFKDLTKLQFESQTNKIKIRTGFFTFLEKCKQLSIPVVILSINWTKIIIEKLLNEHGFSQNENLKILVNEFEFKNGKTTGKWNSDISIRTGMDKLNIIRSYHKQYDKILYIGDSSTDLLPMVESDYGIIMENGSVLRNLNDLHINYRYLNKNINEFKNNELYIGNWNEVINIL